MAKVNLTQGAKLAGVSRSTLNRHIKEGKVSKANGMGGKPCVDTSELQRVYGDLSHDTPYQKVSMKHARTPSDTVKNDIEIAALRAELNATKERLEETQKDRDEWKGQAKTLSLLLTDQRAKDPTTRQRGLLRIFFGGSKA
jgi:predicted site-specific integrase-resolvase